MHIYKINLTKAYHNLKNAAKWDIYNGAIIIAENNKDCRDIAFTKLKGDETKTDLINKRKPANISRYDWNNEVWKNPNFSSCKKIGIPIKNSKRCVIMVDFQSG